MNDLEVPITVVSFVGALILAGLMGANIVGFFLWWGICWVATAMVVSSL